MKRFFGLFIIIMLVISLSACNGAIEPNQTPIGTDVNIVADDVTATDEPGEKTQLEINFPSYEEICAEYPDKTVLVWVIRETPYERNLPFRTREINRYLDSINCDCAVCFLPISYTDTAAYPDECISSVEKLIEGGEQVDFISFMNYEEFVHNGLYIPLDEYLTTDLGKELFDLMPKKFWESLRVNGKICGVNAASEYTLSLDWGYYVNEELAEKYYFDVSKPILEQLDVLKNVSNNENNCDVFSSPLRINNIVHSADVKAIVQGVYWNEETHIAECVLDNPGYIEKLKLYDTLNRNKLLTDMSFGVSDTFFIMQENIPGAVEYKANESVEIEYGGNIIKAIPVFNESTAIRNCPVATGICSFSENKDKAFELLALTYTDPILNNLLTFGIEGEDYSLENNKADGPINPYNAIRFSNDLICHQSYDIPFTAEQYRKIYENAILHEDLGFSFDGKELAKEICDVTEIMSNFALPDINGNSDDKTLDEIISDTRKQLEQAGIQRIIDECNRQYEVYQSEKN